MVVAHLLRGMLGMVVWVGLGYLLSRNRQAINWRTIAIGLLLQLLFALAVLEAPVVQSGIASISTFFVRLLDFAQEGARFLFGPLVDEEGIGYIFAFQVLPSILFFSALTSVLFYLNILQTVVRGFAWLMSRSMKISGAESLSAAANVFIGQTEAPLLVKPYIQNMTRSEVMALMSGGMATIAGGVLAAFVGFLGGDSEASRTLFASHLISASVMSAPASLVMAKLLFPETEPIRYQLRISRQEVGANLLDAVTNGTGQGLRLAVNVGAMLLVFTALMALINHLLGALGGLLGVNSWLNQISEGQFQQLSVQAVLGYLFAPLAWLLGVSGKDVTQVGFLLGEKTILNEFYAYKSLSVLKAQGGVLEAKSILIATYALCGFANFGSIGIQIGGIGALAPNKRTMLSQLGLWSLIAGTLACFMTATIAGMLYGS